MTFLEAYNKMNELLALPTIASANVVRTDGIDYPSAETLLLKQKQTGQSIDSQTDAYLAKNWDIEFSESSSIL
tara:strand:+ start:4755 stop:4973 length:219 start_codon:yes stop_codon:yes gene_type:complete